MSFLKSIFSSPPSKPVNLHDCKVRFVEDPQPQGWLGWLVSFPFSVVERVYNTWLLVRGQEMRGPLSRCVSYDRALGDFSSLFFTMRTTTCPAIMKAMGENMREMTGKEFLGAKIVRRYCIRSCGMCSSSERTLIPISTY